MQALVLLLCLLAPPVGEGDSESAQKPNSKLNPLRQFYRDDAVKYQFERSELDGSKLDLQPQPIMSWANDDDWSGDVFVWTHGKRPAVVGCILSGPADNNQRLVFHEFHLLSDQPIKPVNMQTRRRWQPKSGLEVTAIPGAPEPARSANGRLTQMRELSRQFSAHMRADSDWELRQLSQPLYRYDVAKANGPVIDGALFAYVWTKGTDPEVILLIEARRNDKGEKWYYAPVRFSNRPVWLKHEGKEVWHVDSHAEPEGNASDLIYTTAYSDTVPTPATKEKPKAEAPEEKPGKNSDR